MTWTLLRHGAMPVLFGGVRAPSTLGSFLRSFTWVNARQLEKVHFTKISGKSLLVRGLNVLAAAVSLPLAAPVIAAVRLRGGSAASARGAASFITEAVGAARDAAGNEIDRLLDHGWWAGYSLCSTRAEGFRVAVSPGSAAITAAAVSQLAAMMDSAAAGTATTGVMPS